MCIHMYIHITCIFTLPGNAAIAAYRNSRCVKRDPNISKTTYECRKCTIHVKTDLHMSKETFELGSRKMTHMSKETYICQKRPTYVKRDLRTGMTEDDTYVKRDLHMSKQTYICQKRPSKWDDGR